MRKYISRALGLPLDPPLITLVAYIQAIAEPMAAKRKATSLLKPRPVQLFSLQNKQ